MTQLTDATEQSLRLALVGYSFAEYLYNPYGYSEVLDFWKYLADHFPQNVSVIKTLAEVHILEGNQKLEADPEAAEKLHLLGLKLLIKARRMNNTTSTSMDLTDLAARYPQNPKIAELVRDFIYE